MSMPKEALWLENQICFPLYAVSRMVTQLYTPMLKEMDITYPQYLVLMVLWKENTKSVSEISQKLFLESNTITPLLKRMEQKGLITRERLKVDERKVEISLTSKGKDLQKEALCIPEKIVEAMQHEEIHEHEISQLKSTLHKLMQMLEHKSEVHS